MSDNQKKQFKFTKYKQRHIALKILYFGWDYSGLAAQGESETTIEHQLFKALIKARLVESRDKCNFNRCGRTDKGVSSYGQVVNLSVRSNLIDESDVNNLGLYTPDGYEPSEQKVAKVELNYVDILNNLLPEDIKVIAWAPVRIDFSSRFNCKSRSYSYIFPKGDLCIESMQEATGYLIGEHDFRNICSFDLKNGVTNHIRTIISAKITPIKDESAKEHNKFYEIVIVGQGFLYHQIRCIMTILFLVGSKKEAPIAISDLLDLKKCPAKPNYCPASPLPLCLFDCKYQQEDLPLGWFHDQTAIIKLLKQIKHLWWQYKTKSLMIERVLYDLESIVESDSSTIGDEKQKRYDLTRWKDFGLVCDNMSEARYVELLKRTRDDTLEAKLDVIERKKKIKDGLDH